MSAIQPTHYTRHDPEPITVIEKWHLPFHLACVIKYISRFDQKGGLEDLEKAMWYLRRYINLNKRTKTKESNDHQRAVVSNDA